MQIGDLVKKRNALEYIPQNCGLVLDIVADSALIHVLVAENCTMWVSCSRLEVISASR
jgi:hypothetical protein